MKTRAWVWGLFLLYTQMPEENKSLVYLNVDYGTKQECTDAVARITGWPQDMRTIGIHKKDIVSYACVLKTDGEVLE